jgi:hypothetical protein
MISKKTKALAAGALAAAMSATALIPSAASAAEAIVPNEYAKGSSDSYAEMFSDLYKDVITNGQTTGYLSKNTNGDSFGIPYHCIETLCVEAPDYGHESTSEAMSYIAWVTAMHDVLASKGIISDTNKDFAKGWKTLEAIIPGWSENAYGNTGSDGFGDNFGTTMSGQKIGSTVDYSSFWKLDRCKADAMSEQPVPEEYPESQQKGGDAFNPLYDAFASAYKSDNGYYLMHWLADVDDWYGFGGGKGLFTFINTFQRGEQESCFETVPHTCIEELKYGNTTYKNGNDGYGMKGVFSGQAGTPSQYSFTNAPDAEDRAIQAAYFANQYNVGSADISAKAGKMGDQCRNDMFDKYYKALGCQNLQAPSASKTDSQHFLMAWYTSWGGALFADYGLYGWGWQIGCSHSHQFYQNPLAAYALASDPALSSGMKATGAVEDYKKSLQRQIELYLWLQSANGPFAGGCTNSKNGNYSKYDSSDPLFYEMCYVEHPVYADPGSNHWIGNQVWSMQRLAELYYYVKTNGDAFPEQKYGGLSLEEALDTIITKWVTWFIDEVKFDEPAEDGTIMSYAIPSNLDWSGKPASWNGTYDPNANSGLTCKVRGYSQGDIGCVSSLCNTFIYYAAANGVKADAAMTNGSTDLAERCLRTANILMTRQYYLGRDAEGIAFEGNNGSLDRVFKQEVWVPKYYEGTMPDGKSKIVNGATFSSLREKYKEDPMYQEAYKYYQGQGEDNNGDGAVDVADYYFTLHRFWHMGDALMTTGTMALLYPDVKPDPNDGGIEPTTSGDKIWGDADDSKSVTISDIVLVLQYAANKAKYPLDTDALDRCDCNVDKVVDTKDAFIIQQLDAGVYTQADMPIK